MGTPFLGEVRIMSFNYPPKGWARCDGQFLPINQNQALFALLGTQYGGNGQTTFALPNLMGRVPIHQGAGHIVGEAGGAEAVTVTSSQMPQHLHGLNAHANNGAALSAAPDNRVFGAASSQAYRSPTGLVALHPVSISNVGGSQPHTNMQPYLVLQFCIALQGIFPSQN